MHCWTWCNNDQKRYDACTSWFRSCQVTDIIDKQVEIEDEAYVVEVFSCDTESTIVFNRRIHINVDNFEYLRIVQNQPGIIELIEGHRTLGRIYDGPFLE